MLYNHIGVYDVLFEIHNSGGFAIVGFIDADLFCASNDLIESLKRENETPFCTITGNSLN